jgi:hypothetical protein
MSPRPCGEVLDMIDELYAFEHDCTTVENRTRLRAERYVRIPLNLNTHSAAT